MIIETFKQFYKDNFAKSKNYIHSKSAFFCLLAILSRIIEWLILDRILQLLYIGASHNVQYNFSLLLSKYE